MAAVEQRLVLVAPPQATIPDLFTRVTVDSVRHGRLISEMQALRAGVFGRRLSDARAVGGWRPAPDPRGRKELAPFDHRCKGHVSSCGWYLNHENTASVDDLRVRNCPLARVAEWREKLYSL